MKTITLFSITVLFCIGICQEPLMAKEFRYPGQELNGTWQVVKNDLTAKDADRIFLPVGQQIGIFVTGERRTYKLFDRSTLSGTSAGMKLIFPLNKNICKSNSVWDFLCNDNGTFNLNDKDIKPNIRYGAYFITGFDGAYEGEDFGLLNQVSLNATTLTDFQKIWPDIKNYYYELTISNGYDRYKIYPMNKGNEILLLGYSGKSKLFPELLRRVKQDDLAGTWQVIKYDYYGADNIKSSDLKKFSDSDQSYVLLPIGQKINFWFSDKVDPASGDLSIGMKLLFPIDDGVCKLDAWDFLCDDDDAVNPIHKGRIKNNAYIVTDADEGVFKRIPLKSKKFNDINKLWPGINKFYYRLRMNGVTKKLWPDSSYGDDDYEFYDVFPMKNNNEILFHAALNDGSQIGVLLRRIK